jgi:hypothetical protein
LNEPEWATLTPEPGEIVVAVNLFGVRDAKPWQECRSQHPAVFFVEDHTHDPFSDWAANSTADYAIASLRKTIPVPDGAVIWSPNGLPLPDPGDAPGSSAALALAGMLLKKSYLETGATDNELYQEMRLCQQHGEERLSGAHGEPISHSSREYLSCGVPADLRERRQSNVRNFLDALDCSPPIAGLQPMFRRCRPGLCPLNPVLLFDSHVQRDACRANLLKNRIYAAVHWPLSKWMSPRAADIASRALTIPLDFRCAADCYLFILEILRGSRAPISAPC